MGDVGQQPAVPELTSLARRNHGGTLVRWLLLGAVVAGLLGMHVLTAGGADGGHGSLPPIGSAGHSEMSANAATSMTDPWAATGPAVMFDTSAAPLVVVAGQVSDVLRSAPIGMGGGSHDGMVICILVLAISGAALLVALMQARWIFRTVAVEPVAGAALIDVLQRGPPGRYRPRVALCVIRV